MKNKYLIIPILLFSLGTHAREKTDLEAKDLKGKVASMTETNLASPKLVRWGCILRQQIKPEYQTKFTSHITDDQGRQTAVSYYNNDHKLLKQCFYTYNSANCVTKIVQMGADGRQINKVVYTYDTNGYPSQVDYYNDKDSLFHPVNLAEKFFSDLNNYYFDDKGRITEQEYNMGDDIISRKQTNTPHKNDDAELGPEVKYNFKGQKARETEFYDHGTIKTRTVYSYSSDGKILSKHITQFDSAGNEIRMVSYDADGSISSQTYWRYEQIDAQGNWHKRIQWKVDDTFEFMYPNLYVVTREIEYRL